MASLSWFDLHCDTLTHCMEQKETLLRGTGHLDLERGNRIANQWVQVFACWMQATDRGEAAYESFLTQRRVLTDALDRFPKEIELYQPGCEPNFGCCTAILSVEGGQVLGGQLEKIEKIANLGVRFLTLVWNGDNELGCGGQNAEGKPSESKGGLTSFGKACLPELERCGIFVDISHLNDAGVEDVFSLARRPVVATHSMMRSEHEHRRNLTDEQFRELVRRGGLCGLNFYPEFVNGENDYSPEILRRHLEKMLELGGEDIIALGSDFDGAPMPSFISNVGALYTLYDYVVEWVGETLARKLFYENAAAFAQRNFPGSYHGKEQAE